MKHFGFVCAVTAMLLLCPLSSWAQEQGRTSKNQRSGFYIGLGFGPGTLSREGEDGSDRGISNMLRVGGTVSQHVLIGVDINGRFNESVGSWGLATTSASGGTSHSRRS